MRTLTLLAAASAIAIAAPAVAQDQSAPADTSMSGGAPMGSDGSMPADTSSSSGDPMAYGDDQPFSGLYVGGAGGYDIQGNDTGSSLLFDRDLDGRFGDSVLTSTGANAFVNACHGQARGSQVGLGCNRDHDGWAYYARVGFDKQYGPFVVGVVGEFGKSDVRDYVSSFSSTPAAYVMERKVKWEAGARLRAGYAANTTLFYGTGGGGYARIAHRFSTTNTLNDFDESGNKGKFGLQAGGGVEQKIGDHFSIGLEYMYHSYKDNNYRVRVSQGLAPATNPFILPPNTTGTDLKRSDDVFRWQSIRATAAFRF